MENIIEWIMIVILVIALCVVLPVMIVWLTNKRKQYEMDKKAEMMVSLLEKHPELNPTEVMQKLNVSIKSSKTIKQKLLENVFSGGMMAMMGLAILIPHLCGVVFFGNRENGIFLGGIMLAMGVAFLIHYFISKKQLRSEIEAEEKQLNEQQ